MTVTFGVLEQLFLQDEFVLSCRPYGRIAGVDDESRVLSGGGLVVVGSSGVP